MTRGQWEEETKGREQAPAAGTPSLLSFPPGHVISRVTQCCHKHEYASVIMQQIFRGTLLIYGPSSCSTNQLQRRGMGTLSMAGREVWRRPPSPVLQQPRQMNSSRSGLKTGRANQCIVCAILSNHHTTLIETERSKG